MEGCDEDGVGLWIVSLVQLFKISSALRFAPPGQILMEVDALLNSQILSDYAHLHYQRTINRLSRGGALCRDTEMGLRMKRIVTTIRHMRFNHSRRIFRHISP